MAEGDNLNRRSILKTIGSGTVANGSLSSSALASDINIDEVDSIKTENLQGKEGARYWSKALSEENFNKLFEKFTQSGWVPKVEERKITRVKKDGAVQDHNIVQPFKGKYSEHSDSQLNLIWSENNDEFDAIGHKATIIDDNSETATQDPKTHSIEIYKYEQGRIEKRENMISMANIVNQNSVTTSSTCPSGQCPHPTYECESYKWSCVTSISTDWAVSVGTCAGCVLQPLTCPACLGAVLKMANPDCEIGDNCHSDYECRDNCPAN